MSFQSRAQTADKPYYGVVSAIVIDNNDPLKEGRVKIKFPWFDEQMVTEWCRVRQLYAGNGYGTFFIPEVDDEVVVAFDHGEMSLPIVLGGLYNGKDKPPSSRTSDKDEKLIQTKGGHKFILDDSNGKAKITIMDSSGKNSIVIDSVANSITIKSDGGKLVLQGQGIQIKSDAEIEINATTTIKVEATSSMDLKGSTVNIN